MGCIFHELDGGAGVLKSSSRYACICKYPLAHTPTGPNQMNENNRNSNRPPSNTRSNTRETGEYAVLFFEKSGNLPPLQPSSPPSTAKVPPIQDVSNQTWLDTNAEGGKGLRVVVWSIPANSEYRYKPVHGIDRALIGPKQKLCVRDAKCTVQFTVTHGVIGDER